MTNKQGTLIYIDKDNISEAEFMSRSFVQDMLKKRAYVNALGAELGLKYLASEGVDVSEIHNLHSISKILEKVDIADVLLPNIHIDARVIFDESQIFIPKSHFELNIVPDVYMILKLSGDFKHAEFLGFVESRNINKANANKDYYFVEKDQLVSPSEFIKFVQNFAGNTSLGITEDEMYRGRELSVSMADHNISEKEFNELLHLLLQSDSLRESVLEFDNFETLSNSVGHILTDRIKLNVPAAGIADILQDEDIVLDEDSSEKSEEEQEEENSENYDSDFVEEAEESFDVAEDISESEVEFVVQENEEDVAQDEIESSLSDFDEFDIQDSDSSEDVDLSTVFDGFDDDFMVDDDQNDNIEPDSSKENNIDSGSGKMVGDALVGSAEIAAAGTIAAAGAAIVSETAVAGAASAEVIKLAAVSGDLVSEIIDKNIESQQENLDKKDYEKVKVDATNLPEHITAYDLSGVKRQADIQAEESGKFESPKDLSELQKVDISDDIGYGQIEHETIDLSNMDTVENEFSPKESDLIENLDHLSDLDAQVQANGSIEINLQDEVEEHPGMDLPDVSVININDDGTSSIDNLNIDMHLDNSEEHLVELDMTPNDMMIDKELEHLTSKHGANEDLMDLPDPASLDFDMVDESLIIPQESDEEKEVFHIETEPMALEDTIQMEELLDMDVESDVQDVIESDVQQDIISTVEEFDIDNTETLPDLSFDSVDLEDKLVVADDLTIDSDDLSEENHSEADLYNDAEIDDAEDSEATLEVLESVQLMEDDVLLESENVSIEENIDNTESEEIFETITEDENEDILSSEYETSLETDDVELSSDVEDIAAFLDSEDFSSTQEENKTANGDVLEEEEEKIEDVAVSESFEQNSVEDFDELVLESASEDSVVSETPEDNAGQLQEQDWLEDTDYENLEDVEFPEANVAIESEEALTEQEEDIISEPEEKVYAAVDNSRVISNNAFQVGEIPIDINYPDMPEVEGNEQLENLYNQDAVPGAALLQTPGRLGTGSKGSKAVGLGILGVILSLIVVGVIGFSVSKFMKQSTDDVPQPISDEPIPTSPDYGVTEANTLDVEQANVVNMEQNTPVTPAPQVKQQTQTVQAGANSATSAKTQASTPFIEVSKLTWEVPDYVSYNPQFKQYLQTVGKSLKLSLSSDLLLATEYAYSNQLKVSILYDKDGTFKTAKVLSSSGSTQIDNIVLQTVNQNLKVLKAPHSVGNDESTTVILKIYF
ncbi:hypothetical protein HDR58_10440 [bacterium]|nr:hypothetical protein [bacterium]